MAAATGRVVTAEQEERAAPGAVHRAHTRSQSHIQFQPLTRAAQWQAPRALAHTRSHSHTHFGAHSHAQTQKHGCRLTHSLSAMTKGEKRAQGSVAQLIKPTDPLFPKDPQQTDLSPKLSLCSKLCFAIGGAPKEVAASATAFFLQIYLLDIAQISAFQASMVLFVGKAWGAITDPLVGFFITKSGWTRIGRLMPWMVGCTPFLVVSYFYLWFVPPFATGRFVWYLGFYCLYQTLVTVLQTALWPPVMACHPSYSISTRSALPGKAGRVAVTTFSLPLIVSGRVFVSSGLLGGKPAGVAQQTECFHVPYSALTMFLSTDQKERDSATAYRMTMEVLGTLVGAAIQGQIVASAHTRKHCRPHNGTAGYLGNGSGAEIVRSPVHPQDYLSHATEVYMIAAGVIGGIFLICTLVMFLGVKERDDPYAPRTDKQVSFYQGFLLVMRHGPYHSLTAAFLFITVAIQLVQSNFVLFCTYAADLKEHFQNIVLTILVSAVISIPLWQWFLERFGKKTAAFCGIAWIMPFTLMLVFIPNVAVAYVVAVSSGLSVAASLLLPWSMLPDVVDDFRLANPYSRGHEAIFYSFYVFFTKFASGISVGVSTLCLQFAGYNTRVCKQPAPVVYTLKLLIGAAPVAFIVTGLMILVLYPISEDVRRSNKVRLEELRKKSIGSRTMEDLSNV